MTTKNLLLHLFLFFALMSFCAPGITPAQAVGPDITISPAAEPNPAPGSPPAPAVSGTDGVVPSAAFSPSRYEALWTKSPFSVATSEDAVQTSPDYMLVGIANVEGVFYASLIERDNQEHFLISSDKLTRGLTIKSITKSQDGQDVFASVVKDNQPLTLKLEQAPAATGVQPGAAGMQPNASPGIIPQQISLPSASPFPAANGAGRPFIPRHRIPITLPPRPQEQPPSGIVPPPASPGTTQAAPPPPR